MAKPNVQTVEKIPKVLVSQLGLFGKRLQSMQKEKMKYIIIIALEIFAIIICLYIILLPFYPEIIYRVKYENNPQLTEIFNSEVGEENTASNSLPYNNYSDSENRLIIPKIGVNTPIILTKNEAYGLSKGAWMLPNGSTPGNGGNTIVSGHRFKYLPPSNLTFYLFHKLEKEDVVEIIWEGVKYFYKIKETKIVKDTDFSVLNDTSEETLTMFTCHPIYSTKQRLVIISERILAN